MSSHFRIGTWNLDRSGIRKIDRISKQLEKIEQLKADIWVLTETHSSISLPGYTSIASCPDPSYHQSGESYVTIWSRLPLRKIETQDSLFTVCAELQPEFSSVKMLIYGTIITYGADGVKEGVAKSWERHREAVRQQTAEWQILKKTYPNHLLCVAGDFNENLDGTRWYGVKDAKDSIKQGLKEANLICATIDDLRSPPYELTRATVDHICLSENLRDSFNLEAWEGTINGMALSDHNGVLVDLGLVK
jgi:hypothetical protein